MKTLITTDLEASQLSSLKQGDKWCFVRVLKEQPPEGYNLHYINNNHVYFRSETEHLDTVRLLQYPIGTELGIMETYRCVYNRDETLAGYLYKSGGGKIVNLKGDGYRTGRKRSSATMPHDAIRRVVKVVGNEIKRVQKLDGFQWGNLGASMNVVINEWNSIYAKPRKCKDGYIAYPDSISKDFQKIVKNSKYYSCKHNEKPRWKDKLLTIHANPYIEFMKARKI